MKLRCKQNFSKHSSNQHKLKLAHLQGLMLQTRQGQVEEQSV
jgi:hypothetical protein